MRQSLVRQSFVNQGGSHVYHMHADSLLIQPSFSSKLMITWLNIFKNSFWSGSNQWRWIKRVFDQFINHVIMNCSKTHFWSTFISSNQIKSEFSEKLSHVIINFEEKLGWIKIESALIWYTGWLPPSHTLLDQKLDPRVFFIFLFWIKVFSLSLTSD